MQTKLLATERKHSGTPTSQGFTSRDSHRFGQLIISLARVCGPLEFDLPFAC
jgi:hypothetical protein